MRYQLLAAATMLTCAIPAQRVAAYTPAAATISECQPASPLFPAPLPPLLIYPQVPALPVMAAPAGDSTFDNTLGYHWVTNGAILAAQPTPLFPPLGPIPPAVPIPAAVLGAIGGGPVTGIAIDSVAGIMYLVGAPGITIGVAPVPGMPVLVPPFPLLFPFIGPITGLEWDSMTGTLYAVNAAGVVYNYFPGGAPAAPPLPPPILMPGMATDVALDRTLAANAAGLRPLYVLAGPAYFDVRLPAPILQPVGGPGQGLAFMNHPATNMPGGPCICPGTPYPAALPTTTSVMTNANLAWGVSMAGLPPGFPVIFGFEVGAFIPFFPVINPPVGCGIGLTLGPTTLLFTGVAGPGGVATFPVPLVPPAFFLGAPPVWNQNATLCAADPTFGLVLSPMQSVYSCAP